MDAFSEAHSLSAAKSERVPELKRLFQTYLKGKEKLGIRNEELEKLVIS